MVLVKCVKWLLVLFLIQLLSACILPSYSFKPNEKTAEIKLLYGDSVTMCIDGQRYNVSSYSDAKLAKIPAGKRISIGSTMSYSGYNVVYTCNPYISFIPDAGSTYVTDSNVISDRCYIELVKENIASETGLMIEESIGKAICY